MVDPNVLAGLGKSNEDACVYKARVFGPAWHGEYLVDMGLVPQGSAHPLVSHHVPTALKIFKVSEPYFRTYVAIWRDEVTQARFTLYMSWAEDFNDGWLSVAQCCNVAPETVRDDMRWPRWAKRSPLWEPWISSPPLWTNQRREDFWRWSATDDRQTIRIQNIYTTIHPYYHIWFI
jgi:hypothetical protein